MMRQVCTRMRTRKEGVNDVVLVAVHSRVGHELVIRCLFPPLFSSKSCRNYDLNEQQLKRLNGRGRSPRSPASERIESDDDEPTPRHLTPTTNTLVPQPSSSKQRYDDDVDHHSDEDRFADKLRDAMDDDAAYDNFSRLDSMGARMNDYSHIPRRWRGTDEGFSAGLWMEDAAEEMGVESWRMNDDEYAEYIRAGIWRYAHLIIDWFLSSRTNSAPLSKQEEKRGRI